MRSRLSRSFLSARPPGKGGACGLGRLDQTLPSQVSYKSFRVRKGFGLCNATFCFEIGGQCGAVQAFSDHGPELRAGFVEGVDGIEVSCAAANRNHNRLVRNDARNYV